MIEVPINTLLIMCGPSQAGKSTLARQIKEDMKFSMPEMQVEVISSDEIRRELLGSKAIDRYDKRMLSVSEQAFKLLRMRVELAMSFPLSLRNGLVIVDSTGLNEEFRKDLIELANSRSYHTGLVLFDYKGGLEEYLKGVEDIYPSMRRIVSDQILKLRTKVLPSLRSKLYSGGVWRVKSKDFSDVRVSLSNGQDYRKACLPMGISSEKDVSFFQPLSYLVVGDVHCCYEELLNLLDKEGMLDREPSIPRIKGVGRRLVLVGDVIDKKVEKLEPLLRFLYMNRKEVYLVRGNHEVFVYRYLKGEISGVEEKVMGYFDSIPVLEGNEEVRNIFFELYESASPFFIHNYFVVHHAPCLDRYIGKLDKESINRQARNRYPKDIEYDSIGSYEEALKEHFSFMDRQASYNGLPIFTGHVVVSRSSYGNQWMLDSGAVYGGGLTGVVVNLDGSLRRTYVPSIKHASIKYLPDLRARSRGSIKWDDLDIKDKRRIERMLGDKPINFLSGTMAPADKREGELESLEAALSYYQRQGVNALVMQKKEMGSRAQLVLRRVEGVRLAVSIPNTYYFYKEGIEYEIYWVSRNGHLINFIDLTDLSKEWFERLISTFGYLDLVILDGELCPWSLMARGLIDHHFLPIEVGGAAEIDLMKEKGFDKAYESLMSDMEATNFREDRNRLSKEELKGKYGEAKSIWWNTAIESLPFMYDQGPGIDAYRKQLSLYAREGTPIYKPFQVLKLVHEGKEQVMPYDNELGYTLVNEEEQLSLLSNELDVALSTYERWIKEAEGALEGVVIKPLRVDMGTLSYAPYLKVRNKEYLRLVYGPSYDRAKSYKNLIDSKKVGGKIKCSIEEWNLSMKMLAIPYSSIDRDNQDMRSFLTSFIGVEKELGSMDPRL
jgi:predicted kinase